MILCKLMCVSALHTFILTPVAASATFLPVRSVVGRIMASKDVLILIPGMCERVIFCCRRDPAAVLKSMI